MTKENKIYNDERSLIKLPSQKQNKLERMLYCISGVGGSGKTTTALKLGDSYERLGYKVLYVVSVRKTDEPFIINRPNTSKKGAQVVKNLSEIEKMVSQYDIIVIDEGWMIEDIQLCEDWVVLLGKIIIISSITKDYRGRSFKELALVSSRATKQLVLTTPCNKCGDNAYYDHRISDETTLLVKSVNKYIPLCGPCFYKASNDKCVGTNSQSISVTDIFKNEEK
jgi:thymidine kinase